MLALSAARLLAQTARLNSQMSRRDPGGAQHNVQNTEVSALGRVSGITDDHLGDPYESLLRASSGYQPSTKVPKLNVALQQVRARATASRHAPAA